MYVSIEFGQRARDRISGFEGIVTARIERYCGATQIELTPDGSDPSGEPPKEPRWFDGPRVERVGTKRIAINAYYPYDVKIVDDGEKKPETKESAEIPF